jgi:hypothetical protein
MGRLDARQHRRNAGARRPTGGHRARAGADQRAADAGANLAALKKADSWDRDDIITKAGWTTFPGSEPDRNVARACAALLSQAK